MKVVYFFREPRKTGFSIEGIFNLVIQSLKTKVDIDSYYLDPGISRLKNIFKVRRYRNTINHITGDVYFLALGFKGDRNILTIHDIGHYDTLRKKSRLRALIYYYMWLYLPFKKADIITVVSDFTRKNVEENFPFTARKLKVIYDPVKPVFKLSERSGTNTKPQILQIGTGPHKNLNNLIEAVKGLNCHLQIVGWPDELLKKKLFEYKISYTISNGLSDDELWQKYKESDIVFFASFYEGFGMPIIEAQAVGRPVITSNIGAMQEIAADSAVLVDPYDSVAISEAIEKLIKDRQYYNEIVQKGLRNIEKFHHEKIADDYYRLYQDISSYERT